MPTTTHTRSRVCEFGADSNERGFTVFELALTVAIALIIGGIAVIGMSSSLGRVSAPAGNAAGGATWRAIMDWRSSNQGQFPAAHSVMVSAGYTAKGGTKLTDAGGRSIFDEWPTYDRGKRFGFAAATYVVGSGPPAQSSSLKTTAVSSTAPGGALTNLVAYAVSTDGSGAWLAVYGPHGTLVFARGVGASATSGTAIPVVVPVG